SMAIVTLEDLQGTIEVVVFPRLYEQTMGTWRDGEILLVAGRVDHKSDDVSLLADLAVEWDAAAAAGEEAFARQVAAGERGGGGRRGGGPNGNGYGGGQGNGQRPGAFPSAGRPLVPVGPGAPAGVVAGNAPGQTAAPAVPFVSPRRVGAAPPSEPAAAAGPAAAVTATLPTIAPAEPVSTYPDTPGAAQGPDQDDEPSVPDEARARIVSDATADAPVDAGPDTILHVRFAGSAAPDRVVGAMETFKTVLRDRPGGTRVVIYVPAAGGGEALPMELRRGVAYDAELLAEVRRRLGDGLVDLRLA
ncbi:MAG: OB-fold nucleic acid binding domain-containing protein, partial [Chloroflexota bacterium]